MAGTSPAMTTRANKNGRDRPGHENSLRERGLHPVAPVALHIDRRADGDALVEVDHVLVQHAHAAGGDLLADGPGLVGAVDAEQGVGAVLVQVEGAGAERVFEAGLDGSAAVPA